ncbi:MAG: winged helix-turn-helix transcriptional regulator [Pseudomonadota bacterium]
MATGNQPRHRSPCPIARSLDLLGDKWTLIIMRDALYFDRRTFADFCGSSEHIPTNLLSDRLKRLVEMELLEKVPYQHNPTRYEYVPTKKGQSIRPILKSLSTFGQEHLGGRKPSLG